MKTQDFNGKTGIIYARCSTNEKQQSTKIQIEQLEKFCNENGIKVIDKFSENVSGAKEHREELEKILYSEPMADLLIIREISRISREEDYLAALEKVRQLATKYSIYILLDNYYIEKGKIIELSDGITMMVKLYGAAEEREKIKERTSTAKNKYLENPINAATGTRFIPFGLMKVDNPNYSKGVNTKKIWGKNPEEWPMVEKFFELKKYGYSYEKISQITGIYESLVRRTIKSKKIRYYMEESILNKVDEETAKNNSCPSPTKHQNKYKNLIFVGDTNTAMAHQCSKGNGEQYRDKNGKGSIKVRIIDDIVKRTLYAMMVIFDLKKEELSKDNKAKMENYSNQIEGLMKNLVTISKDEDGLNRKFIKAPNEAVENMISKELEKIQVEKNKINKRVEELKEEIKRLNSIDYNAMKIKIDDTNFVDFIQKYIRRIEFWHQGKNHNIFKVYVYSNYIPSHFFDCKIFEVVSFRHYSIKELHNEGAVQIVGGETNPINWDCKAYSLPNYTDEEFKEIEKRIKPAKLKTEKEMKIKIVENVPK